jgi:putative membrane protein
MKKRIQFFLKSSVIGFTFLSTLSLLILTFTFASCNNGQPKDSKEIAEDHNEAKFDEAKENDAEFLVSVAEINLEQIQLGTLAQTNATNTEVKSLGDIMASEHEKALNDLQKLAEKKQITIPLEITNDGQEANKKLMEKRGKDFDKEYSDMMVSAHKDAIDKFEEISTDATDIDIRNWAASMIPVMRIHLDRSISCQEQVKNMQ